MITAIPVNDDRVANHFTKASHLVLVDERGVELSRTENPALGAYCSGKRKLVDLLVQQQVSRVVVRNIGERMLGKLLGHQIAVYQTDCGRRRAAGIPAHAASTADPGPGRTRSGSWAPCRAHATR